MQNNLEIVVANATGLETQVTQISLRSPLEFQSNRLYDVWANGQHFIAKEFLKPDEWQDAPAREFQALQLLEPLDIAPRPVFYDSKIAPIVVYEFMEGEMWDRYKPSPDELAQLTQVWLKMHEVPNEFLWFSRGQEQSWQSIETIIHDNLDTYAQWSAKEFPAGQRSVEKSLIVFDQFQIAAQELATHAPTLCFCRADPRFANVIRRPNGRLGLVDWEDSGLRDPARDLADLITHPNQEDLLGYDEWQVFLVPYLAARSKLDAMIQERLNLYLAIFPVFWLAILLDYGLKRTQTKQINNWQVNGIPANDRLRRYLARALAWPKLDFREELDGLGQMVFFPT